MKSKTASCFTVIAGLICIWSAASAQVASLRNAQSGGAAAAPNSAQGAPGSNQSGLILLDVLVTDKSGAPVTGLQAEDFKLFDKKQPQSIVSVLAAGGAGLKDDPPAVAILIVDAVNASMLTVSSERQMLDKYLKEGNGQLSVPVYLAILTDRDLKVRTPATQDRKALEDFLDANTTNLPTLRRADGWEGDMEREQLSLKTLDYLISQAGSTRGRKLFIWLSPGWRLQTNGQWEGASKSDQQQLFDRAVSISNSLRAARVTMYSIDPYGSDSQLAIGQIYDEFMKGLVSPKHADYGYVLLQVLSVQSGGQALYASNDLGALVDRCLGEAKAYYVLSFDPPFASHPGEYHPIEVQVDRPGMKVRTKTIYYNSPAAPAR